MSSEYNTLVEAMKPASHPTEMVYQKCSSSYVHMCVTGS